MIRPIGLRQIAFALIAFHLFIGKCLCDMTISTTDITIKINSSVEVELLIQNETRQNDVVEFLVQHPDIVSISPRYLYIDTETPNSSYRLSILGVGAGKSEIVGKGYGPGADNLVLRVSVYKCHLVEGVSHFIGWLYFSTWSMLFYPQMWTNYKRKSVVGLNLDYVVLNVFGHVYYSIFNIALYYVPVVKEQYARRFPKSAKPVVLNDVIFVINVTISTIIIWFQTLIYDRGDQKVSKIAKTFLLACNTMTPTVIVLVWCRVLEWLDFVYVCSFIKLAVTLKYLPQVIMNFKRKSTEGWSIWQVIFDISGGILSMIQMVLVAYNYDDWLLFAENGTKFGLGLLTIIFDIIFIIQHFVLYKQKRREKRSDKRTVHYNAVQSKLPADN